MLAHQAYLETRHPDNDAWKVGNWLDHENFGLIPSREAVSACVFNPELAFETSFRFWELVKACPLRMPSEP